MLELRPSCEHCNKPLPPAATDARVCSFECTYCADCATGLFSDCCPNCGGNLVARPIRPARDWRGGNYLGNYAASTTVKHSPKDLAAHAELLQRLAGVPPELR